MKRISLWRAGGGAARRADGQEAATGLVERRIAAVLRGGVLISLALMVAGVALLALTGHTGYGQPADPRAPVAAEVAPAWPHTVGGIVAGALAGRPYGLLLAGLLVVIATPVLRVAISAVTFIGQGDRAYALIALAVLAVLVFSFLLGSG